jgi:L-rhamnose-H+ transport protein
MVSNPFLGIIFHWLGGLASASFYLPYRGVKKWAWETYWLAGGFFSWIIAPWVLALFMTNDVLSVISETAYSTLFWTYFCGVLWGLGGLTYGLTMRYLGLSLGMATVLGFCAAFGTLMPPIFTALFVANGTPLSQVFGTTSGLVILCGVGVCLAGIAVSGMAGMTKEKEMSEEQKRAVIKEFSFKKGMLVAIFSGVMSACFSYGIQAGGPMRQLALNHGTDSKFALLPVYIVILLGGFTTNFIWCLILHSRNGTGGQYFSSQAQGSGSGPALETAIEAPGEEMALQADLPSSPEPNRVPLVLNYILCAIAGTMWYFQFFFYAMGESQMGRYKFSSWTLHMASIIIFGSLWGIYFKEWKGASRKAKTFLFLSIAVLVGATIIIGYGNYLATLVAPTP